ncbi:MAG: histidine phosphatase family protein [Gemmatimonadetes bacterium]|nr:histidine phosphatase family protein [Gemmatimonadota bacterium]NIR78402.1 histidine phosphatase family protein [Gemmatimonadota bacterium]NIT87014.1 histidine phosphatase family protein [Gemmatimonadota bacterium]NIU30852.1 histidine phosphatase family protein [Gemmatimonadota bacterium]NIU35621.1 histidine phosphatase family protein [Gemmatimonadota bacterium]
MTALNAAGRYQGWADPPLSAEGEAQAVALRGTLSSEGIRPGTVWTSDLRRARRTAEIAFPDVPTRPDPRLRELSFGAFEGRSHAENLRMHGGAYRRWLRDPERRSPPRGETLGDLRARVREWLEELSTRGTMAVVAHGGPIAVVTARILALPPRWEVERGFRPAAATPVCARWSGEDR